MPFQAVVFREAAKGDSEGALESLGIAVDDVGEDADLGGLVDEAGIFDIEQCDDGAGALADGVADPVELRPGHCSGRRAKARVGNLSARCSMMAEDSVSTKSPSSSVGTWPQWLSA
jgi:hypothetical protein